MELILNTIKGEIINETGIIESIGRYKRYQGND
jgi:hypothetical protein